MWRPRSVPLPWGRVVGVEERKKRDKAKAFFVGWLLLSFGMNFEDLGSVPTLTGEILADYGRDVWSCGGPRYLYVESILSVADQYGWLRTALRASWDVDPSR